MPRYSTINTRHELYKQFRRQKKCRCLTNAELAEATDLAEATVERALRGKRMTIETAVLIGDELGFRPEHVVCCWMANEAVARKRKIEAKGDPDSGANKAAAYGRIHDDLLRWAARQRQMFRSRQSGRRLAARRLRVCGRGDKPLPARISRRDLAESIVDGGDSKPLGVKRRDDRERWINEVHLALRSYEGDRLGLDDKGLGLILHAISSRLGEDVDLETVDAFADQIKAAHSVLETAPWKQYPDDMTLLRPASVVMDRAHAVLRTARSKTCLGPIEVEFIEMEQTWPEAAGSLRILNARHAGLELAVVLQGRARLTLSQERLPDERLADRVSFTVGEGSVVHDGIYHQGDVLVFDSSRYHRVECMSERCQFVSILIGGNVAIGHALEE